MTLLHIDSSILDEKSTSKRLTAAAVQHITSIDPTMNVVHLDLASYPVDHLSIQEFLAWQGVEPQEGSKQKVEQNNALLDQFLNASTLVIGAPMYNFSLPSQLKSWLDRLSVAGITFRYTENGPVGLATGKRVIVISTRGGFYTEGAPTAFLDHQEAYITSFFKFLGITEISIIRAEGLALGEEAYETAIQSAVNEIKKITI